MNAPAVSRAKQLPYLDFFFLISSLFAQRNAFVGFFLFVCSSDM